MRAIPCAALVSVLAIHSLHGTARGLRIGDCAGGEYAPNLSTVAGLPFENRSSGSGKFTIAASAVTLGACPETPAAVTTVRRRHALRARWDSCGSFTRVRLRLELGPGGGSCDYVVGLLRWRTAGGRRRALKFPASRVGA
jgi:hypothetical protein